MYIITFLFITILWQLALVVTLFLGRELSIELMKEFSFYSLFWLLIACIFTFFIVTSLVDIFIKLKKESYLSGYHFPKQLTETLEKEFPHLKKEEIKEISTSLKNYFGFILNHEKHRQLGMPSFAVEFAYKSFIELDEFKTFAKVLLKNHLHHKVPFSIQGKNNKLLIEVWAYFAFKENLNIYDPKALPSIFQLDSKLNIPKGFSFNFTEELLISTIPLSYAPSPLRLCVEIESGKESSSRWIKKVKYLLGNYNYCQTYQQDDFKALFRVIDKNRQLCSSIYGQYSDGRFKENVLSRAKVYDNVGSSGASV